MTTPRWLAQRAAWAQPTTDIHARRRARARQAFNRARQERMKLRRRDLLQFFKEQLASPCPPRTLRDVYEDFQRRWVCSRSTFFRDLRAVRAQMQAREAAPKSPDPSALPETPPWAAPTGDVQAKQRPRTHGGVWLRRYVALELALCQILPRVVVDLVKARAAELTAELSAVPGAAELPQLLAPSPPPLPRHAVPFVPGEAALRHHVQALAGGRPAPPASAPPSPPSPPSRPAPSPAPRDDRDPTLWWRE